jgi:predicted nucleic acid-binding protein
MRYLVDSSALTRIIRRQVDPVWHELVQRGLLSLCEPVLAETLQIADTKEYAETETFLTDTYVPVTIPDGVWDLSAAIRHELAPRSAHRGLSVADLVVAATAIKLKLTVLHEDADYETVGRFVPQLRQRRISLGPEAAW